MDPTQTQRLDTIRRLQAELIAQVQAWSRQEPSTPAPAVPRPKAARSPQGRFGAPRYGLTPEQAWLAETLLRQKKPFRGQHRQQKEAARIRGILNAVRKGYVNNRHWGRSMLGKLGGKAMRDHALGHLRAIAHLGGEAKRDGTKKQQATAYWEQTGEPLPLTPRETGGQSTPNPEIWAQYRPFLLW
jgi:hypothetical protein